MLGLNLAVFHVLSGQNLGGGTNNIGVPRTVISGGWGRVPHVPRCFYAYVRTVGRHLAHTEVHEMCIFRQLCIDVLFCSRRLQETVLFI